jgi:hypothetical protein
MMTLIRAGLAVAVIIVLGRGYEWLDRDNHDPDRVYARCLGSVRERDEFEATSRALGRAVDSRDWEDRCHRRALAARAAR